MSVIHIKQIQTKITSLFEEHLDLTDIKANDLEREQKIATRCLAAYAIYMRVECSAEEAAQAIVDGGDDNGIDAIFYSPLNNIMVLVQSKFSKTGTGDLDAAGVSKFTVGARDLFNLNFDRFNEKVKRKSQMIDDALNNIETNYEMIIVDTYTSKDLSKHASRHIEDLLAEINATGDDNTDMLLKFERINQAKVYKSLAFSAGNSPIDIEVGMSQWGQNLEPYKAVYGMVSGSEIASWWETYQNRLFERNIRQVLGRTDVNDEIQRTLKDTPNLFWYYNNGITIICDKVDKTAVGGGNRDYGTFKLTNAAVVNGAQTVSNIGRFILSVGESNLDAVKVSVRVIQLQDAQEGFGKEVTRTNNRQNRIENRDFVSQDPEQNRLKTELAIDGIDYNIMRSETYASSDKSFDLAEATASLACASGSVRFAVLAKSAIGKFWENLDVGIYKEIFNGGVSGHYVYNCVQVIRVIEEILKAKIKELPKRSGRTYGVLVHGNRMIEMLTISKLGIHNALNEMNFAPDVSIIENITESVIGAISTFVESQYSQSLLATVFKNSTKCAEISSYVKGLTI